MSRVRLSEPQSRRCCCTIDGREVRLRPQLAQILEILLLSSPWLFCERATIIDWLYPDPDESPLTVDQVIQTGMNDLRSLGVIVEARADKSHHPAFGWNSTAWRIPPEGRGGPPRWIDRIVIARRYKHRETLNRRERDYIHVMRTAGRKRAMIRPLS